MECGQAEGHAGARLPDGGFIEESLLAPMATICVFMPAVGCKRRAIHTTGRRLALIGEIVISGALRQSATGPILRLFGSSIGAVWQW